jgi:hypothetical protein
MGVLFFGDESPDSFGAFSLAFVALFRITAGETAVPQSHRKQLNPQKSSRVGTKSATNLSAGRERVGREQRATPSLPKADLRS